MPSEAVGLSVGWYGKIPGAGDFASRGVARDTLAKLDEWVQTGLQALDKNLPDWLPAFLNSPAWNMILPAGKLSALPMIGCVAPSRDRVGRGFPLTFLLSGPQAGEFCALIGRSPNWLCGVREVLQQAMEDKHSPDQLDRRLRDMTEGAWPTPPAAVCAAPQGVGEILDIIGPPSDDAITVPMVPGMLPWPDLPAAFSETGEVSYWWSVPNPVLPCEIPVIHHGPLDGELFCRLFGTPWRN